MSKLAGALDVRAHRFGAGAPFTVGIEEEYMLLDPESFDLVPGAERILEAERDGVYAEHIAPELFDSLVEFHTGVCATAADAGAELRRLRQHAVLAARHEGLRLGSAGTHPFSLFELQRVMSRERYGALIRELQYAGRRELIYGLHVHVGVDDPDRAIHVVNALRAHLCELVALSANSPFWRGASTGYASCRHMIVPRSRAQAAAGVRVVRRVRDGDRAAGRIRQPRGLHADLVGRAAAPALRHDRGSGDGRCHLR